MDPDTLASRELIMRQQFTPSDTMNAVSGHYAMDNYVAKILSARRRRETSRFSLHVPHRLIRTLRTKVHPGSSPTPVA
jgi:hypothetical protein